MTRTIIEIDAPAYWANYLVNNDAEGLDPNELEEIAEWLANEAVASSQCVGIKDDSDGDSDAHFIGRFNFAQQGTLQCDMFTYTFIVGGDAK